MLWSGMPRKAAFGLVCHHDKVPLIRYFTRSHISGAIPFPRLCVIQQIWTKHSPWVHGDCSSTLLWPSEGLVSKLGQFILILWRWGQRFYTDPGSWLGIIHIFHMQLLRFDPADLEREEFAAGFRSSAVGYGGCSGGTGSSGTSWSGRGLCSSRGGLRPLKFILHPVNLDKVIVGRQLGGTVA